MKNKDNSGNVVAIILVAVSFKGFIDSIIILSRESIFCTLISILAYWFFIYCFLKAIFGKRGD
jgi:presenilin-like A22 family membrane protease